MKIVVLSKTQAAVRAAAAALILVLLISLLLYGFWGGGARQTVSPIYSAPAGRNQAALMINVDWGQEIIPGILEVLEEKEAKATFFITGRFAENHPEIVKTIADAGHLIANHGYSHPHVDNLGVQENQEEIIRTQKALEAAGVTPSLFYAAPYGESKEHVIRAAEELGYRVVYWTLDTVDWQEPSVETILERIVPKVQDGSLILAHPKECTLKALPDLIDGIKAKGLSLVRLSDILPES
ncbi:MAG: polysaccharide deacetylase family protein [Peptococcaceae bacterium]|nr:polysaccharide deacetylase family protein [Peptococcaceae bacterium]